MGARYFGASVKRREDPRFLRGEGRYVDDIKLTGMLHMSVVRSTHAHARLRGVDVSAAKAAPGVALVMTGNEVRAWGEKIPAASNLPEMKSAQRYPLSNDVVRFVGEGVAAVVASDRYRARDAADLIDVEYEDLPVVIEIVDSEERINAFLPELQRMVGGGLVTLEPVRVVAYNG